MRDRFCSNFGGLFASIASLEALCNLPMRALCKRSVVRCVLLGLSLYVVALENYHLAGRAGMLVRFITSIGVPLFSLVSGWWKLR